MNNIEYISNTAALNTAEYQLISSAVKQIPTKKAIDSLVIDLVGPLNARERWELFENAGFPQVFRSHLKTIGSAMDLSISLVYPAIEWGYPVNIMLLELVGVENIKADGFDNTRVAEAISKLHVVNYEQSESIQQTMRRHENRIPR